MEAKKVIETQKMKVNRMLRTNSKFKIKDYEDFIEICNKQIEARKQNEINELKENISEMQTALDKLLNIKP